MDRATTVALLRKVMAACEAALAAGSLVSVADDQIRVRPLPIERPTRSP